MLQGEMTSHLGYENNARNSKSTTNRRNGYSKRTVRTTNGNISISRLLEIILNNEIDEFLIYANEYTDKINNLIAEMEIFKAQVKLEIVNLAPASYTSRKEYAEVVKKYPSYMQYYLFRYEHIEEEFKRITISGWKKILSGRGAI